MLTLAQEYFDANIVKAGIGNTTWTPVSFAAGTPDRATGTIKAQVSGTVNTFFARVAGPSFETIPVNKTASVTYN